MDTENVQCECKYCSEYAVRIHNFTNPRWLTISPDPKTYSFDYIYLCEKIRRYMNKFNKLTGFSRDFVLVWELSKNDVLHLHCMFDLKDEPKEYRYLEGWKLMPCQIRCYDGFPEHGIHYLFKGIDRISRKLHNKDTPIIWTRQSTLLYNKKLAKINRVQAREDLTQFL